MVEMHEGIAMLTAWLRSCITTALAAAALAVSGMATHAASFDCRAATTQVERLICTENRLSEVDERVALAYHLALQSAARPDDVRTGQRQWVRMLAACKDSTCVALAQEMRLALLGGQQDPDTPPPARVGETFAVGGHVSITITAVRGIGTRDATIGARMTERDAVDACHGYVGEPVPTRKCIADWIKEGGGTANVEYRANCVTGLFRVGGSRVAFLGRNAAAPGGDAGEPDYLVTSSDTGGFLQDGNATGYPVLLSAFRSLCPGVAERAPRVRR